MLFFWVALCVSADPDDLLAEWNKAKERYVAARDEHKTTLLRVLSRAEETARKEGNVAAVQEIQSQVNQFELDGTLPLVVKTLPYERDLDASGKALLIEAKRIQGSLLTVRADGRAQEVAQEAADIVRKAMPNTVSQANRLRVGWIGTDPGLATLFSFVGQGEWRERDSAGVVSRWVEVNRTDLYVELQDPIRRKLMRIFNDRIDTAPYRGKPWSDASATKWGNGRWVGELELSQMTKQAPKPTNAKP